MIIRELKIAATTLQKLDTNIIFGNDIWLGLQNRYYTIFLSNDVLYLKLVSVKVHLQNEQVCLELLPNIYFDLPLFWPSSFVLFCKIKYGQNKFQLKIYILIKTVPQYHCKPQHLLTILTIISNLQKQYILHIFLFESYYIGTIL